MINDKKLVLVSIAIVSILYSGLNLAVLIFINKYLLSVKGSNYKTIVYFIIILIVFFIVSLIFRGVISIFSHKFIYEMRLSTIKRTLDTSYCATQSIGRARLIATLSSDITSVSNGFIRIPEIIQGTLVVLISFFYITYLSAVLAFVILIWLGISGILTFYFSKKLHKFYDIHRKNEDELYKNYETIIDGHKEFSLNLDRAESFYISKFKENVKNLRKNMIYIDFFQSFISNWINIMTLGATGIVIYLSLAFKFLDLAGAVTISLSILFLRAPLMMVLFAYPSIIKSKVALNKIKSLNLANFKEEFDTKDSFKNWNKIELKNISFGYKKDNFILKDINLVINRGEIIFLIGKNGSGKSTLFLIIAGLIKPNLGEILVDGIRIDETNIQLYKNMISAIFSDFYLFNEIDDEKSAYKWMEILEFEPEISNGSFRTKELSQGQKKRLALVNALLENRGFLMLDEWAADQDPQFRIKFYTELLPMFKNLNITVFAISHDDRYFDMAKKIYQIDGGKLKIIK